MYLYVPGPALFNKDTDNGHTFGSKTELVGETSKSYLAAYGNNVYVLFTDRYRSVSYKKYMMEEIVSEAP